MSRKWAIIIIFTVVTVAVWSGYEVYKAFSSEKEVTDYAKYATRIENYFDTDLIRKVEDMQEKVLVKSEDIEPKNSSISK